MNEKEKIKMGKNDIFENDVKLFYIDELFCLYKNKKLGQYKKMESIFITKIYNIYDSF